MEAGIVAELDTPEALLAAVRGLRERGYRRLDAFTPYPVAGLEEALGERRSPLALFLFPVGITAAGVGYLVQWLCNAYLSPLDVGGRPPHSAPTFIPITFESGVLVTGVSALLLLLLVCGLPRLSHPVFDAPGFESASIDRFWIGVDALDPRFDKDELREALASLGAANISFVGGAP